MFIIKNLTTKYQKKEQNETLTQKKRDARDPKSIDICCESSHPEFNEDCREGVTRRNQETPVF